MPSIMTESHPTVKNADRFQVLDGWRGVSIACVLIAHLIPLAGPRTMRLVAEPFNAAVPEFLAIVPEAWNFNASFGYLGMALFFNLSGFLITSFLLRKDATAGDFVIRRFFRIVPLAWLYLAVTLPFSYATVETWVANYLFYANLPPKRLVPLADHFWSLCVEVHFYCAIAAIFYLLRARGLLLIPLFAVFFTLLRFFEGIYASSITYFRIDEILAGAILALCYHGRMGVLGNGILRVARTLPQWLLVVLLVLACTKQGGWLNYLRPYFAALLIAATLLSSGTVLVRWLQNRVLAYLATISYALYVIHLGLLGSWLGTGELLEKYLKRPLLFIVLFILAHISTFQYEQRWIACGRKLSELLQSRGPSAATAGSIAPTRREREI